MAVSAATALSGFSGFLTPEQAGPIFEKTLQSSIVQSLAQRIPMGFAGVTVPVVTGSLSAGWVAEGAAKPASAASLALKTMAPKKIATIAIVSAEVVRANPGGYMDLIRPQIAKAFAVAFDSAAFHGTSTPFAQYFDQTTKAAELGAHTGAEGSVYRDLNTALELLVRDGKYLTGWAFDSVMEPTLLAGVDLNGRPIFLPALSPPYDTTDPASPAASGQPLVRHGSVLGRPSAMGPGVATADLRSIVGYAGDWSQVVWGQIGGISYDVSTQATATINGALTSLWENNLVGIRAETEFGLLINDVASFVKLTNAIGS